MTNDNEATLDARLDVLLRHDPELVRHILRLAATLAADGDAGRNLIRAGQRGIAQGRALIGLAETRGSAKV